jgi:hypothetical protein
MKVQYFADTDTLYIEFRDRDIAQSKDLVNTIWSGCAMCAYQSRARNVTCRIL